MVCPVNKLPIVRLLDLQEKTRQWGRITMTFLECPKLQTRMSSRKVRAVCKLTKNASMTLAP